MFKLLVLAGLVALGQGYSLGKSSSAKLTSAGGYTLSSGGGGGGYGGYGGGIIPIAIQSKQKLDFYNVPSTGYAKPITIDVGAQVIPLKVLFRSKSSLLNIEQIHEGQKGSVQEDKSEDEPHLLKHVVKKPIVQEVREVIVPLRKITQEIKPVQEEIQTIVARNSGHSGGAGLALGGGATLGGLGGGSGLGSGLGGGYGASELGGGTLYGTSLSGGSASSAY